jgi:hypothetical protein
MRKIVLAPVFAALTVFGGVPLTAQTASPSQAGTAQTTDAGITAKNVIGEVTALDVAANLLTLKADGGKSVSVNITEKTSFMRAQPGAKNLEGATKITFADVGVGDRVLAVGKVSDDHASVPATTVVVMTKGDIAQKHEHERAEWRRRGIAGEVTGLNPQAKEITISTRSRDGVHPVVITAESPKVVFRRYAPDSVKFSDAKLSSFSDLKPGDQLRALGDKNEDGSRFTPEEIVSGTFRTLSGAITSVNASANEIKITDSKTKQPITVVLRSDTLLKRIPPEMAAMMAQRAQGAGPGRAGGPGGPGGPGGDGGGGRQRQEAPDGPQGGPGQAAGGGRGPRAGGGFDFQDIVERLPVTTLAELKPGDVVVISSTSGAEPNKVTAIALVSGVDPLLNALQPRAAAGRNAAQGPGFGGGDFNFGIGAP